jgi:predicted RNA binding protein YcfA (HicA-like mRNA interferase family)
MPLSRRKVEKALKKKGFKMEDDRDHRFYFLDKPVPKKSIFTKISTGTDYKTLGNGLVGKIARQIKLSKDDFLKYVDCSISLKDYYKILKSKKLVS